ncbi:MAG: ABC transporter ATP-binding protein, partial [Clostridiales bacterium]|nr:ABC transporter ATP-binding protein [Clostridiales bacterium]
RDIPQGELRRHVRLILQEPFLYSRTVGENIRAARSSASLSEVRSAARTACIDEDIAGMPQGSDTVIGDRGVTLSGGQKQRVAIAQALLAGSPVLLMDDALSAVDTQTDEAIRASLLRQTEGRTLILISHRVTTLMKADHILVLDHGRVAEEGTHETLISHDGPYRRVYEIQMNQKDRTLLSGEGSEA